MAYRKTPARLRHAEEVKKRIIDTAAEIIRTAGLNAVTIRTVVDRAGTSVGNYYHHFPDKEALLAALVERVILEMEAKIDAAAGRATTVRKKLEAMVETGVAAALEDPELSAVLLSGGLGEDLRARIARQFIERTERFFKEFGLGVDGMDAKVAAALWQGSILTMIEGVVSGAISVEPSVAARSCARWNVRALGLPDEDM